MSFTLQMRMFEEKSWLKVKNNCLEGETIHGAGRKVSRAINSADFEKNRSPLFPGSVE